MWTVRFQFDGSKLFYGNLCKNYNLEASGYNLSSYEKGKDFILTFAARLMGEEKNIRDAIRELKKDKRVLKVEENNKFVLLTIKENKLFKPFSSPLFIYLSPAIIQKGIYTFHVASWERKDIEKLLTLAEKFPNYKLISIKQEKIKNISVTGIQPNLTEKQKKAYELAIEKGYYEYPKKITLKQLAKLSNISYSTFQQHLSYAEKKIAQYMYK